MSKEFPQFSEDEAAKPETSAKPKRSAAPRPRKTTSANKSKKSDETDQKAIEEVKAPVAEAQVLVVQVPVVQIEAPTANELEWSETAAESVGGTTTGSEGVNKRKRRRRKGKGGVSSVPPVEGSEGSVPAAPVAPVPQAKKSRVDPESLAKAAWKIYLAEVSEEGVALVGDQDARDLARRCFRLAEIFMEERGRRSNGL